METLFTPSSIAAALRIATPLLLASLGGAFAHHVGIFNIALEGFMLAGAFVAVTVSYFTSSWILAIFAGMTVGLLLGLLFGMLVIRFKTDVIATGFALNLLCLGATTYLLRSLFNVKAGLQSPRIQSIPDVHLPLLDNLGILNIILNNQSLFTYVAWILGFLLFIWIYHTPSGVHLRAAGEHAEALETAGVSVTRTRYAASALCGILCGLAGAHLALGYLDQYLINISSGRGFIAVAIILFGNGNPLLIFAISLLFGLAESLSIRFQSLGVPGYFALMIPYVVTIVALVIYSIRSQRAAEHVPIVSEGALEAGATPGAE